MKLAIELAPGLLTILAFVLLLAAVTLAFSTPGTLWKKLKTAALIVVAAVAAITLWALLIRDVTHAAHLGRRDSEIIFFGGLPFVVVASCIYFVARPRRTAKSAQTKAGKPEIAPAVAAPGWAKPLPAPPVGRTPWFVNSSVAAVAVGIFLALALFAYQKTKDSPTSSCNDPVIFCSGVTLEGVHDEQGVDGRRDQAVDGQAQERVGAGDHPGQDDGGGGLPAV